MVNLPFNSQGTNIQIHLTGNPKEIFPVQGITWYYDKEDLYHYILIGSNFNPLSKTYEKIFIIHISPVSARKFYEHSKDFFDRTPEIQNRELFKKLEKQSEYLKSQLFTLSKNYMSFHSNCFRITLMEGEAELTCFYLDPFGVREHVTNRSKLKAEPIVKFTMGVESMIYFITKIKETKDVLMNIKDVKIEERKGISA